MSDRDSLYLSEEELNKLICQVEETEMLKAPAYLKRETMEMLHGRSRFSEMLEKTDGRISVIRQNREIEPVKMPEKRRLTEKQSRMQLLVYSVKVTAAAAAAIAMLFLLPAGEATGEFFPPANQERAHLGVVEHLEESSSHLCQTLNDVSRWLVSGKRREEKVEK